MMASTTWSAFWDRAGGVARSKNTPLARIRVRAKEPKSGEEFNFVIVGQDGVRRFTVHCVEADRSLALLTDAARIRLRAEIKRAIEWATGKRTYVSAPFFAEPKD